MRIRLSRNRAHSQSLTAFEVAGYKSISSRNRIECRPLTVLAGANGAGKSALLEPILLLKQTVEFPFDPGPLLLDGPNVHLEKPEDLLSRAGRKGARRFSVKLEFDSGDWLSLVFDYCPRRGLDLVKMVSFGPSEGRISLSRGASSDRLACIVRRASSERSADRPVLVRNRCFYELHVEGESANRPNPPLTSDAVGRARRFLENFFHISGLRVVGGRSYPLACAIGRHPGVYHLCAAMAVHRWQENGESAKLAALEESMRQLGLGPAIMARRRGDTRVELLIGRLLERQPVSVHDWVSAADAGFGVLKTLPLLIALSEAEAGDTVYVEQPENHLFPETQERLGSVLAGYAGVGRRLIVETHSAALVRGIHKRIGERRMAEREARFYWCQRDPLTGATEVKACRPDGGGKLPDWPLAA